MRADTHAPSIRARASSSPTRHVTICIYIHIYVYTYTHTHTKVCSPCTYMTHTATVRFIPTNVEPSVSERQHSVVRGML